MLQICQEDKLKVYDAIRSGHIDAAALSFPRVCLKIYSRHLSAPLRGIFVPNSGCVAHYAPFIWPKSPTKCDAQLTESNFQTHPNLIDTIVLTMKRHGLPAPLAQVLEDKRRDNHHIPFAILLALAVTAKLKPGEQIGDYGAVMAAIYGGGLYQTI